MAQCEYKYELSAIVYKVGPSKNEYFINSCLHNIISEHYASYDIKCHIMTNDAYDIEI